MSSRQSWNWTTSIDQGRLDMALLKKPLSAETRDQLLHGGVGLLICLLGWTGNPFGWALAGFVSGTVREVTEQEFAQIEGRRLDLGVVLDAIKGSKMDLAGWTLIPFVAGVLIL